MDVKIRRKSNTLNQLSDNLNFDNVLSGHGLMQRLSRANDRNVLND